MTKNYQKVINQRTDRIVIETNKVLKNTYILLSLTLIFSSITALFSALLNFSPINPLLTFLTYFGLLFSIRSNSDNVVGLILTFALTGFLGITLGPILNFYILTFSNGSELIMISLGSTGLMFLGLSSFSINSTRDFSRLGSFLGIGSLISLLMIIINIFLQIPAIHLALSLMISFISAGMIVWQTNQIIYGGERNYIIATITLYVSILNIFLTLLQFLSIFIGNRE